MSLGIEFVSTFDNLITIQSARARTEQSPASLAPSRNVVNFVRCIHSTTPYKQIYEESTGGVAMEAVRNSKSRSITLGAARFTPLQSRELVPQRPSTSA